MYDMRTAHQIQALQPSNGPVAHTDFSSNGHLFAMICSRGSCSVIDLRTSRQLFAVALSGTSYQCEWLPDSDALLTVSKGTVQVLDALHGNCISEAIHQDQLLCCATSRHRGLVVA